MNTIMMLSCLTTVLFCFAKVIRLTAHTVEVANPGNLGKLVIAGLLLTRPACQQVVWLAKPVAYMPCTAGSCWQHPGASLSGARLDRPSDALFSTHCHCKLYNEPRLGGHLH